MQVIRIEEECLKLDLEIDEMSEQFVINVQTASYNSSCDSELTTDGEMGGADPLDSLLLILESQSFTASG
jgi:hypothetical protein